MSARNRTAIEHMRVSYESGEVVLCIGAGVHDGILPSWTALTQSLATRRGETDEIEKLQKAGLTMPGIYQILSNRRDREEFTEGLWEELYGSIPDQDDQLRLRYKRAEPSLLSIAAFCMKTSGEYLIPNPKVRAIINLNVDDLLPRLFNDLGDTPFFHQIDRETIVDDSSPPNRSKIPIYQIHGLLSSRDKNDPKNRVVFTEEEYHDLISNPSDFANRAFLSLLTNYPTVFVGTSLTDDHQRHVLRESHKIRRELEFKPHGGNQPHLLIDRPHDREVAGAWTSYVQDLGVHRYRVGRWSDMPIVFGEIYGNGWEKVLGALKDALG